MKNRGRAFSSLLLHSGSSYLSQSEVVLTSDLGEHRKADTAEVRWPNGQVDWLSHVAAGQTSAVQEDSARISARAFGTK